MGSIRIFHVVCLLSLLLRAWRVECQTLSCSDELGANTPQTPQVPQKGKEPQICVSKTTCCTRQTEESLRVRAAKNIKTSLQTKYMASKSSLFSLYDDLKGYFQGVIREGHRHSALFLINTQKNLTTAEINVISNFFKELENYLVDDKMELQDIVNTFFRNSFPLVLEYINPLGKTVSNSYKQCLKTNMDSIQPFGKRPAHLVGIFEQVFEPVRNLLSSVKFGIEVLSMAQQFNLTSGCKDVLLQMKFCSLCQGLNTVKPCHSYCMDTVSNCLASETQLQAEWGSYVDTVFLLTESIGKSDLENFSNSIYKDLWNAATYVLIQKANVMSLVFDKCGTPTYIDASPTKTSQYANSVSPTPYVKVRLFAKMGDVKRNVYMLTSFFRDLPHELCVVDELAAKQTDTDNCWNGKSVAKYTGLDTKPGTFLTSLESVNYFKMLVRKIQEKNVALKKSIVDRDGDDRIDQEDGSGSASGSASGENENKIDGSACNEDDEDCGSAASGRENGNENEIPTVNDDGLYFSSTTPSGNVVGGGVGGQTSPKPGDALARGNSSSTLTVAPLLQLLALSLFVMLTRK